MSPEPASSTLAPPSAPRRRSNPLWRWLDERFDLAGLMAFVRHKEVPVGSHSLVWYFLGGVTLFFFTVQIVSGILLLMYYQAGESTSYESMRYIVTKVPFGWLVRSVHCWSAHLMILSLLLHMWSVFFLRAYRKPRELTWFTGIALFGLALGFGFSGYLLPWNELAFFATAVGTDSVKSIPVIGEWLLRVMRGGDEVSIRTLYRFYALHVCVLPIATFTVVGIHLLFVQKQGMAPALPAHADEKPKPARGMPFFPNFALRDVLIWLIALNLLALLAVLLPYGPGIPGFEWELGHKADPFKPAYPGIKPEWYFLWMYQMLREFPAHFLGLEGPQACLLIASILMLVWLLVPFLDRRAAHNRPGPAFTDFGVGILYFLGFLMLKAWDVGAPAVPHGVDPVADPAAARHVAATAATWMIGIGAGLTALRAWAGQRWFWISALPLLQAALQGFAGMTYVAAGGVCLALLAVVLAVTWSRSRATAALAILLALGLAPPARAGDTAAGTAADVGSPLPESNWPAPFRKLITSERDGRPIVSDTGREHFRALPAHAQRLFFSALDKGLLDDPDQLAGLLSLEIPDETVELLLNDNCVLCHSNPNQQSDETLFRLHGPQDTDRRLDLREVVADVHLRRGLSCSGCHGGDPKAEEMPEEVYQHWPDDATRKVDHSWIPGFCTDACHSQPGFMRRFNPSLPVDQMLKYRESRHGQVLLSHRNERAAQCISCHGVHGIRRPTSPESLVYPANIPATCGRCHADPQYMKGVTLEDGHTPIPTDQLAKYRKSVHGRALLEKNDLGAPACNDCHGNHAAMPPAVAAVSQICRNCHVNNGKLFDGSPHKAAFEKHGWPECVVCHGKHDIQPPSDAMLGTGPGNVCKDCHDRFGKPGCNETAQYFHDQIQALDRARGEALAEVDAAERQGQDLADVRFSLAGVDDALVDLRTKIHSFSRAEFDKPAKKGFDLVREARTTTEAAVAEYSFRTVGLAVSTLFMTLLAVALYFKLRQVDRATGYDPKAPPTGRPGKEG
jgi:cytochrome b6